MRALYSDCVTPRSITFTPSVVLHMLCSALATASFSVPVTYRSSTGGNMLVL